jgi:hypothetical protein
MISEDEAYEKAIRLHPELADWDEEDFDKAERKEGVNWQLHLHVDAVVFRRASDVTLPDGQVIQELERRGKSEQEAVHSIAKLIAEDLWARMQMKDEASNDESLDIVPSPTRSKMEMMSAELNRKIRALAG